MKKILFKIQDFFRYMFNFRKNVKHRGYQRALKQAIVNDRVDKIIAKDIIVKDIKKLLVLHTGSKYIPDEVKNREEVKMMVIARHSEKMKALNIVITDDLKLV